MFQPLVYCIFADISKLNKLRTVVPIMKKTNSTSKEMGLTKDKSFDYGDMGRQFGEKTEINITYSLSYNPE